MYRMTNRSTTTMGTTPPPPPTEQIANLHNQLTRVGLLRLGQINVINRGWQMFCETDITQHQQQILNYTAHLTSN